MRRRPDVTRRQRPRPLDWRPPGRGLRAWLRSHAHSLLSSLGRLWNRPVATALTVGVIAVALSLPLALLTMLANVQRLAPALHGAEEIPLFLDSAGDATSAAALGDAIVARFPVDVRVQSPEQSLSEFQQLSGFSEALQVLDYNPLPYMLLLRFESGQIDDVAAMVSQLEALDGVDFVQFDARWRERLQAWLSALQRFAQVLAAVFAVAVLLVVGNTVRLDVQTRADEILIIKLLGATDGFVRRPFLYLGLWYGLMGGALAVLLIVIAIMMISPGVHALAQTYGSEFGLQGPALTLVGATLGMGVVLGWLGAWVVTARHMSTLAGR